MKIAGIIGILLTALLVQGDVFTLRPLRGSGRIHRSGALLESVNKSVMHKETFSVNGVSLEMEIFRCEDSFDTLLAGLKKIFQKEEWEAEGSTLRVGYRIGSGMVERWLIIREQDGKAVLFRITAPENLPRPGEWPAELPPLPAGAEAVQIMHFPARKSVYGSFRNAENSPQQILRSQTRYLESNNWIAAGAEAALQEGSRGDLFIRTRFGREIIWLNSAEDGTGNCYYKKAE